MRIGYAISSEEHAANDLVTFAQKAEDAGLDFALISDHFHPWLDRQGQSPFVWSVLGAIAHATRKLRVGTGVTCPTMRTHPAIVAQAAATTASMMPGRFFLGVGTGENLNEHITGERWPNLEQRSEMLREAVEVMRSLWTGDEVEHRGAYFTVQGARLYTLRPSAPKIYVAADGRRSAALAAEIGDGLIGTAPMADLIDTYMEGNADPGPRIGQLTVCWAPTHEEAKQIAFDWWPNAGLRGELTVELPLPRHFEQATRMVSAETVASSVVCGPDPAIHLEKIRAFVDAGFDHVYVHQIGPDQAGFFSFYAREILPAFDAAQTRGAGREALPAAG